MIYKLLVIIPCFNEEASLNKLLPELLNIAVIDYFQIDVLIVNDCSTDDTVVVARKFNVKILDLPVNLGIGGAMQSGYLFASKHGYDLAVQMDGDGQHPPSELYKLLSQFISTSANVIIGSRFIVKEGYQSSALRRTGINYLHWLNKILTGKKMYDCTSGFRLLDKKAILLAAQNYPDEYPEPESIIIFSKAGLTIEEVPVVMRERQGGQSSIRYFAQLYYMIKVSIAMFFSYIRK
jgi:hypothetical protein